MQLLILGKTPYISLAELETIYGADSLQHIALDGVLLKTPQIVPLKQIGGVQKVGKIISSVQLYKWPDIRQKLEKSCLEIIQPRSGAKIKFGISLYGFQDVKPQEINATTLSIKKILKTQGYSSRIIANKKNELNSAQVNHGKLLSESGFELVIFKSKNEVYFAKTTEVQDIDAYAARDQARPMRDARVGMLPPKLAQSIINISGFKKNKTLLDPFCGTGVILQEALLMGGYAIGSDLEPRMVEYTIKNLTWLADKYEVMNYEVVIGDATTQKWGQKFDTIACETYLGRPLSSLPDNETLYKIVQDCNTIHKKFLQNIASQTKKGFRMCIAVPAWNTKTSFKHLPVLDSLDNLGYNRISFVHCEQSELLYHRKGQIVARELVVLERN